MFHQIPLAIRTQMKRLEEIDARDRVDGTPRMKRLRQIPPETGKFLAILAAGAPEGEILEIGTSAGYSTLWLALAGRLRGQKITTYEILEEKVALATRTFKAAQVEEIIELVAGDARSFLPGAKDVAFCFLDVEKEIYGDCYEAAVPNLVAGGLLVADNAINHRATLKPVIDRALNDERVDAMVLSIGKGLLLCRKI
jgi:predicted O-methyltransferase YrrM